MPATPFELSRIYAKGWAAGMSCPVDDTMAVIAARAEELNPCQAPDERARWNQGFTEAVSRKLHGPQRRSLGRVRTSG
jgi:ribosome modulation factor